MPLESLETEQTLLGSATATEWSPVRHPIIVLFMLKLFEVLTLRHLKYLILMGAFCNFKETSMKHFPVWNYETRNKYKTWWKPRAGAAAAGFSQIIEPSTIKLLTRLGPLPRSFTDNNPLHQLLQLISLVFNQAKQHTWAPQPMMTVLLVVDLLLDCFTCTLCPALQLHLCWAVDMWTMWTSLSTCSTGY